MDEETRRGPISARTWVDTCRGDGRSPRSIGIAIGLAIDWFPAQGSSIASDIDTFWDVLLITSVPVFVLVTGVVLFSIWRWHMRPGEETLDGPPIHGNTKLEVYWTLGPALLIAGALRLRDDPAARHPGGARQGHARRQRDRRAVRLDVLDARERQADPGQPDRPAGRRGGPVQGPLQGRPARLLGSRVAPEGRRRPGDHHGLRAEADQDRPLPGRMRRALRPRARLHAPVHPRRHGGRLQGLGRRHDRARRPGPAAAAAARRPRSTARPLFVAGNTQTGATACGACHTLSAAGTTAQTGPNLDKVAQGLGRGARSRRRSRTPARRSPRASARTSCRPTTSRP